MNNKQVMLEALEAQLLVKQNEANEYTKNVFDPQVQELNDSILEWFHQNVRLSLIKAEIASEGLNMYVEKERWASRLELSIRNYWREKDSEFQFCWSSGNTNSDSNDIEYGIVIGRICENYEAIKYLVMNDWTIKYKEMNSKRNNVFEPVNQLTSSIWALKNEIENDQKTSFMKPGFSLKLKTYKNIEWVHSEDGDSNERELRDLPGERKLQTGRSKYDYTFVREFKVNKKIGYKYDITVVDHSDRTRNYQVTEKQFGEFIEDVVKWESTGAQQKTEKAVTRFNEIMESIAKEKEAASKRSTVNIQLPNLS